jgi:hypothetical protein
MYTDILIRTFHSSQQIWVRIRWRRESCFRRRYTVERRYTHAVGSQCARFVRKKKLMIGFDAEPTVVVYHKTGKTSERLLDNNYPWMYVVWCGLDCKGDGKNRRYVVGDRRCYRMTYVPVAVYSHDKYRWIYDKPSIPVRFVRPRRTEKGIRFGIRIPYLQSGFPWQIQYTGTREDLSGLGEQYVENNQGWKTWRVE